MDFILTILLTVINIVIIRTTINRATSLLKRGSRPSPIRYRCTHYTRGEAPPSCWGSSSFIRSCWPLPPCMPGVSLCNLCVYNVQREIYPCGYIGFVLNGPRIDYWMNDFCFLFCSFFHLFDCNDQYSCIDLIFLKMRNKIYIPDILSRYIYISLSQPRPCGPSDS